MNYSECITWLADKSNQLIPGEFYNVACAPYQKVMQKILAERETGLVNLTEEELIAKVELAREQILKALGWE